MARNAKFVPSASFLVLTGVLVAAGCSGGDSDDGPERRQCGLVVWYHPARATSHVEVVASWENFARPGRELVADHDDGWRATSYDLPPGEYAYYLVEDGVILANPNVATTTFHQDREITADFVERCDVGALRVDGAAGSADGHATISLRFLIPRSGELLDARSVTVQDRAGNVQPATITANDADGRISVVLGGLAPGKHTFTIGAKDSAGRDGDPALATVWIEPRAFDWRDAVVYQIMVDR